ncbi:MAG: hypothetical protein L6V92_10855 [Phocaeicola vulgatus]|nr:MAG: hypothetical protein L6V92_10855 [Phocaeicola vulgatus]
MMNHPQPTPIEKLLAEKQQVQEACRKQEEKLNQTFAFIQANAGSLLLSGFSSLLFPAKPKGKNQTEKVAQDTPPPTSKLQLSDFFSLGKALLPVAWEVAQPLLVSLGIKLLRKRISNFFKPNSKEKNKKRQNKVLIYVRSDTFSSEIEFINKKHN